MNDKNKIEIGTLSGLLAGSIGNEKAATTIEEAARKMGLGRRAHVSMDEALGILEKVAEIPGIVGVSARFAKSRLHLATM